MIVDDSLVARTVLQRLLDVAPGLEVCAVASTAEAALKLLDVHRVDVILLDLDMPGMGGLEALPRIIEKAAGARILVVSAFTVDGAEQTLAALSLGAADTMPKQDAQISRDAYREILLCKIRAVGAARSGAEAAVRPTPPVRPFVRQPPGVLAIGASTGGIHALTTLFRALPRRLGIPILVTQHLPPAFLPAFVRQLKSASGHAAMLAEDGMPVAPELMLIAPGDAHMMFATRAGRLVVRLDRQPSPSGCMPSLDPMLASLADEAGAAGLGVVLSGMGRDGVVGAARLVAAGGSIMAQDEASSAVWGMPRAVAEAGLASAILPPEEIAVRIAASVGIAA